MYKILYIFLLIVRTLFRQDGCLDGYLISLTLTFFLLHRL